MRTLPEGSDEEMIAGRFAVSAGQPMHIPIFTLQNSARTWYRPKEFLPERWMEGEAPAASAAASATGAESETATVDTSVGGLQQNTRPATNTAPFCPKCPFSGKSSSTPEEVIGDWQTLSTTKVEPMSDKFYDGVGFTDGSLAFFPFSAGARSCPAKLFAVQVLRDFLFELVSNIHLDPSGNLGDAVDLGESVNAVIAPQDKRSTTLKVRRILSLKGLVDNAPNSLEGDTAAENIDEGWADEDEEGEEDIQNS